jgi:hypothetical protein
MTKDYKSEYAEKLKDPRWQKMRLAILSRDEWTCQRCGNKDETLHVHHKWYERGCAPWEYPLESLITFCCTCHESETSLRKDIDDLIIRVLRQHFIFDELLEIMSTFAQLKPFKNSDKFASYILSFLQVENLQERIEDFKKWEIKINN